MDEKDASPRTKFIRKRFKTMKPGENMIDDFHCALQATIPLQGTLYITNRSLYFHSAFNQKTFFGKATKIRIDFSQIEHVGRANNKLFLPNSIKVILNNGEPEVLFTGFISREEGINTIELQLQFLKQKIRKHLLPKPVIKVQP